jgi:integrase/recombinase XerD
MKKIFMRNVSGLSYTEGLEKFINYKTAMNKSEDTIKYYTERGNWFYDFLKSEKSIELTDEIKDDIIEDYIVYKRLKSPNISDHTINNHIRAIRAILYYFMDKGYTEPFHIQEITAKKIPKEGYKEEEQEKLIKKPNIKKISFPQYRNWVIAIHEMASANRSKTVRFIKIRHVNLSEQIIALDEVKNNEGYEMPIDDFYLPILKEYMKIRGGSPDDFLFCNQFGKQLSRSGLSSAVRNYNLKRGVEKTSIHRYRHTFAKNWLLKGGSKEKLQHALGQKSSHMVDEYARLYGRELREDFSQFTPLAKMKNKITDNKRIGMKKAIS